MLVIHWQRAAVAGVAAGLLLSSGGFAYDRSAGGAEEPISSTESPVGEGSSGGEQSPSGPVDVAAVGGDGPQQLVVVPTADLEYDPLFDEEGEEDEVYDPLEPSNRVIYRFNRGVSNWIFEPLTQGYRIVVPGVARRALQRAFHNLNGPIFIVNNLLQLRLVAALKTFGAFAMNLSFGLGGLVDASSGAGLSLEPADFGQTLAGVGVGAGPYIIMPLLGPTTLRDGFGFVVDRAFHPLTYILAVPVQLVGYGGIGVVRHDEVQDHMKALEESSIDSYAVLRSAYAQAREKEIEQARAHPDEFPGSP
ncbi:MAG: VacJ family lipoprotein [bacterium]|jgi:phospholipid-binding lipoprotein MlaA|nr:VacJ family lipoprotein [bacterium]